ncbi:MAG: endonuclease III domain-containing protein [Chlamydiae bacterium]|nr:endonuclease III domain-containing protein [Chlamydiota bacterium]MBI3266111.1 endonuclease III domain-containing protein [Chlamydiota bacterium]
MIRNEKELFRIYKTLYQSLGPQSWWPGETPLEVMVGAVLTQNTAWSNVEKAIQNLKKSGVLSLKKLRALSLKKLSQWIRPSGYFNLKAKRLKVLIDWFWTRAQGKAARLKKINLASLRKDLLGVYGVGPETADSILLYALDKKTFVVDAYTKRIFSRHGFIREDESYENVKNIFEKALPKSLKIYNEFHALIVKVGKDFCRKKPLCSLCPLEKDLGFLTHDSPLTTHDRFNDAKTYGH